MNAFKQNLNACVCTGLALLSLAALDANAVGSTAVKIVNPEDIAKALGTQHPFQKLIYCQTEGTHFCDATFKVPVKQRLIVEFVALDCNIERGKQRLFKAQVVTTVAGEPGAHLLNIINPNGVAGYDGGVNSVTGSQVTHFYADAGSTLIVQAETQVMASDGLTPTCIFNLSGQLVDIP